MFLWTISGACLIFWWCLRGYLGAKFERRPIEVLDRKHQRRGRGEIDRLDCLSAICHRYVCWNIVAKCVDVLTILLPAHAMFHYLITEYFVIISSFKRPVFVCDPFLNTPCVPQATYQISASKLNERKEKEFGQPSDQVADWICGYWNFYDILLHHVLVDLGGIYIMHANNARHCA